VWRDRAEIGFPRIEKQQEEVRGMMMEASFDTEESFDDPSCLAPQPPGSVSPAKRQIKEVKETKTTVSILELNSPLPHLSASVLPLSPVFLFFPPSVDIVFKLAAQLMTGPHGVARGDPSTIV